MPANEMGDDDESGDEWDDFGSDRESVGDEEDGMEEDESRVLVAM
jgi:hypothetical protein